MQCFKPIYLEGVGSVPCGKCVGCRIARTREWAIRLLHESKYYENNFFVTLTYDDEHLPVGGTLVKDHLQRYIKRLRLESRFRFFGCGEYGDLFGRPHYHVIMLGDDTLSTLAIVDNWEEGIVNVGNVTINSINYVTGYVQKKYSGEYAKEIYGNKLVPFCVQSKGIGRRYLLENAEYMLNNMSIRYKGKDIALPRYYAKILQESFDKDAINEVKLSKASKSDEWFEERGIDRIRQTDYVRERAQQRYEELKARVARSGKPIK